MNFPAPFSSGRDGPEWNTAKCAYTCDAFADMLPLLRSNELDAPDRQALVAHLSVCVQCREVLAQYDAMDEELTAYLNPVTSEEALFNLDSYPPSQTEGLDDREDDARFGPSAAQKKPQRPLESVSSSQFAPVRLRGSTSCDQIEMGAIDKPLSTLDFPDLAGEEGDVGYSPEVAWALISAYTYLKMAPNRLDGYAKAFSILFPHLQRISSRTASVRQQMRLRYVMAMAYAAVGESMLAIDMLDEAGASADRFRDYHALARITFLRGQLCAQMQHNHDALADYHMARQHWRTFTAGRTNVGTTDPEFELALLTSSAVQHFRLAYYQECSRELDETYPLLGYVSPTSEEVGAIRWTESIMQRWKGNSSEALRCAIEATTIYTHIGRPAPLGSVENAAAESAVDVAESFTAPWSVRERFLRLADTYLTKALAHAREAKDTALEGAVRLTEIRCSRLRGLQSDRLAACEEIAGLARRVGDMSLLGRAYTELGNEIACHEGVESALPVYRVAYEVCITNDTAALGIWPARKLLLAQEMDVSERGTQR